MAGASSARDLRRLALDLERQGCRVRETKTGGGFIVIFPEGKGMLQLHGSISDSRAFKNQRAAVRRAGLVWPAWYKV